MGDPSFTPTPISKDPPFADAEWQSGAMVQWVFQRPTRITGFELRGNPGGSVLTLRVAQMTPFFCEPAAGELPIAELTRPWVGFCLPVAEPGMILRLQLSKFVGEIRPLGFSLP
jgi:hypothetical protein